MIKARWLPARSVSTDGLALLLRISRQLGGVPIIVDEGRMNLATVGYASGPMAAGTEVRVSRVAELSATALVVGYRDEPFVVAPHEPERHIRHAQHR
jgi:hypothetical protein